MRRVSSLDFPLGSAFHKVLAGVLSLAIVLGPASAVAYDDDRYTYTPPRLQDYQNQYRPQNNFSPSFQLDRQINNMNSVLTFKQNVGFIAPKIDLKTDQIPRDTFKPKILFQLAMANPIKAPVQDAKPLQPITIGKPGFFGAVQSIFKGIGAGFQKVGQAIGNVIQRVFTRSEKPGAVSPQQKEILAQHPNLQPTGPNAFVSVGKATVAFGKVWEPGSTFTAKDGNLRLNQGVTMESSFGGIKDKNGGLLPVSMANVDGAITPVGLDFDRMRAGTALIVSQPTRVEGFGTIHPGEMTYQGPVKGAANTTIGGRFNFQGVKVDLDQDAARQFGVDPTVTLKQATFALQAGLMRLNSALLEQGDKRIFIQESKPPLDIKQLTAQTSAIGKQAEANTNQLGRLSQSVENRSLTSSVLFNNLAQQTGLEERIAFSFSNEYAALKKEAKAAAQQLAQTQAALTGEDYNRINPEEIARLGEKVNSLSTQITALEEQAQPITDFQRALSGMAAGLKDLSLRGGDVRTMQGADKITDNELNRRTVLYFPEEKAKIKEQADAAINSLQSMVVVGQMSADQAAIMTLELLTMRDNAYAAKPNNVLVQAINASFNAGAGLVNRAVDVMYFDQLNALAEMFPKTGEAVGTYMLVSFKGAKTVSQVVGVGGLVYFGVTAAVSTGAMLATAYGVAKVAEKFGVDEAPAQLLGFLASIGVGSFKPIQKHFQKADLKFQEYLINKSSPLAEKVRGFLVATPKPAGTKQIPLQDFKQVLLESNAVKSPSYKWQFDAMNAGPLPEGVAKTFWGGKYSEGVVPPGMQLKLWKGGTAANPGGSFYSFEVPKSRSLVRIDSAVKAQWVDNRGVLLAESPVDSAISLTLKPGEKFYFGPTSNQSGVYMGGIDRIQVFVPSARSKMISEFKVEHPLP
ncbi:MAG: hypothetical protein IPP09_03460 [Elusimicrobia bacterium]|nr:hypothetical protein [Elusimicrobiota bacterium]